MYIMETDFDGTHPNSRIMTTAYGTSEDELCACAQACNVDREMINIVSPAHPEQQRRMERHLGMGWYVETMSFEFYRKPDREKKRVLMKAIEAVRSKNCLLRTRLVRYKGQALQVVLSDEAKWHEGHDFSAYKDQAREFRMDYGSPLFNYALLEDKIKTYFVWTFNYSCLESWMPNLILDDLQKACWDFAYFMSSMRDQELVLSLRFWDVYWARDLPRQQYITSKRIDTNIPGFDPLDNTTVTGGEAYQVLHLPVPAPHFDTELSVVAHAAWALASYKGCTPPEIAPEVKYTSANPASYGHLQDFQNMMSPIQEGVQIWVPIERRKQIPELLSGLGNASDGIIGKEHGATKAPGWDILYNCMLFRGVFKQDSVSAGCPARVFTLIERGVPQQFFKSVYAGNIETSHDYGLLLDIQKGTGFIEIQCTWNTIIGRAQVDQMFERFIHFFEAIVNGRVETVGDLLPK